MRRTSSTCANEKRGKDKERKRTLRGKVGGEGIGESPDKSLLRVRSHPRSYQMFDVSWHKLFSSL